MDHTTRAVIGEAAYIKAAADILLRHVQEVENLVYGKERLTPIQEAEIANANTGWAASAKNHVELATQYVDEWKRRVDMALSMEPRHHSPGT